MVGDDGTARWTNREWTMVGVRAAEAVQLSSLGAVALPT